MINNPQEEYLYTANSKEQNYISKCMDEFTALSEEEKRNLKLIFDKYNLIWGNE